jgi:hypothetical protein
MIQFLSPAQRVWFLGSLLLIANTALAYSDLPLGIKAVILLMGVLLPVVLLFLSTPKEALGPEQRELSFLAGPGLTLAVIGLGLVLRFIHLTDFRPWLTGDESQNAFHVIDLIDHPHWQFFYSQGEQPPLLIWSLTPFFKFCADPFFSLLFLPALLSSLALLTGWAAARALFPGSFGFFLTALLALSFWPLNFGRFCEQGTLVPFWELTALTLLIWAFHAPDENRQRWRLFLLGLWTGLGTLAYTSWLVIGAGLTVVTFAFFFQRNIRAFGMFLLGSVITALPFLFSALSQGYLNHLSDVAQAGHFFGYDHQLTALSYITSLFWGNLHVGTSYGPRWGGMLNPILSTGFFLGLSQLWARRREAFARWTVFGLLLSLLPGLLSADYVEHYRIVQAMPFILLVAVLGMQEVVLSFSPAKTRMIAAVFLFLASFGLDMNHLWKPVKDAGFADLGLSEEVRQDNVKAYRLLESAKDQMGPGLIFTDFLLASHNNSLSVMTHGFNAAMNPKLDPQKARWAGVIINVNYQPFLSARFPHSQWRWISEGGSETDGGLTVGLIPLNDQTRPVFRTWLRAHDVFHRLNVEWIDNLNLKEPDQQAEANLVNYEAQMAADPFLESCFDEWKSQYHYGYSFEKNIEALQRAVRKGYPAAHLYFKLGYFLLEERRFPEARAAFEQALSQKPNYTNADGYLQLIDQRFSGK